MRSFGLSAIEGIPTMAVTVVTSVVRVPVDQEVAYEDVVDEFHVTPDNREKRLSSGMTRSCFPGSPPSQNLPSGRSANTGEQPQSERKLARGATHCT